MLDMGFLPDIRRVLAQAAARASRPCSSRPPCRAQIVALSRQLLDEPGALDVERPSAPATGVAQAIYPVRQELKSRSAARPARSAATSTTCWCSRAPSIAPTGWPTCLERRGVDVRPHPRQPRRRAQRTKALEGFKSGRYPRAGRHRRRRARHRRRGAVARRSTSTCPTCPRTTSTASAAPRAPAPPARRSRSPRTRSATSCARSSGRSASPCRVARLEGFDYEAKPRGATSRSRSPSGWRRIAREVGRSGPCPGEAPALGALAPGPRPAMGRAPAFRRARAAVGRGAESPPATAAASRRRLR